MISEDCVITIYTLHLHHLMLPLRIDDVHGPVDVINGIPLNVAMPFSSVNRFCTHAKHSQAKDQRKIPCISNDGYHGKSGDSMEYLDYFNNPHAKV